VTGDSNVGIGRNAGLKSATGNVAIGNFSLDDNTGNLNVSIGYGAMGAAGSTASNTVAVGYQALYDLTSGAQNTAVGYQALLSATTANNNTAIGYEALEGSNTSYNTAVGTYSLKGNTLGERNTAVGWYASTDTTGSYNASLGMRAGRYGGGGNTAIGYDAATNTTGNNNVIVGKEAGLGVASTSNYSDTVAVGYQALYSLTTGVENTAVGYQAGTNINTGDYNTIFGYQAGQYVTTANHNSLFGRGAGQDVTGANNVGMGSLALADCVSSNNNIAIGYSAARGTSGSAPNNTVAIGYESLRNVTTANTNVAIGRSSGYSITTGGNNVLLGHESGYSLVGGASNVMLGYRAGFYETGSNKLYIANSDTTTPLIYGDFNLRAATINGDLTVSSGDFRADSIEINGRSQTTPAAGEYGAGSKIVTQFATGTVTAGVVYVASSGAWVQGDADVGSASIGMIAVATDSASATSMLIEGVIKLSSNAGFSGASAGDVLYLSNTAGELTTTAPSGTGDYVRVCGYVVNASQNEVFFSPSKEWRVV
jgi:hypothetical protein